MATIKKVISIAPPRMPLGQHFVTPASFTLASCRVSSPTPGRHDGTGNGRHEADPRPTGALVALSPQQHRHYGADLSASSLWL